MEQQLLQFIANHWLLVAAFVILLIAIIAVEMKGNTSQNRVSPQLATQLMNHDNALILDVRDSDAYKKGHIINALNIPSADINQQITKLQKYKKKPIIVCCYVGQQATKVAQTLKTQGFDDVRVLHGGFNAWQTANLPVVKD